MGITSTVFRGVVGDTCAGSAYPSPGAIWGASAVISDECGNYGAKLQYSNHMSIYDAVTPFFRRYPIKLRFTWIALSIAFVETPPSWMYRDFIFDPMVRLKEYIINLGVYKVFSLWLSF